MRIPAGSDIELLLSAQAGDRDAFGVLVTRHAPLVRRLTRTVLRHDEDADDAAQDAFLSAWKALDRFDPREPLAPWLARIALNSARDLSRRRRVRETDAIPDGIASASRGADRDTDDALLRGRLRQALATLPERQRVALVLYDVEGYAHAEIGALLGVPEGTARSEVFHARRKLRAILSPGEERSHEPG